jgi:hypothetical protein
MGEPEQARILDVFTEHGYGIYTTAHGYAAADPLDDADGFYQESPTLAELAASIQAYFEWVL